MNNPNIKALIGGIGYDHDGFGFNKRLDCRVAFVGSLYLAAKFR